MEEVLEDPTCGRAGLLPEFAKTRRQPRRGQPDGVEPAERGLELSEPDVELLVVRIDADGLVQVGHCLFRILGCGCGGKGTERIQRSSAEVLPGRLRPVIGRTRAQLTGVEVHDATVGLKPSRCVGCRRCRSDCPVKFSEVGTDEFVVQLR